MVTGVLKFLLAISFAFFLSSLREENIGDRSNKLITAPIKLANNVTPIKK